MFDSRLEQFLESVAFNAFGTTKEVKNIQFVGGGCINNALKVSFDSNDYFVKWNEDDSEDLFLKENNGLNLLRDVSGLNIPETYQVGRIEGRNYLIMEFIQREAPNSNFWDQLGENVASIHQTRSENFGLHENNYIGRLPQSNEWNADWIDFLIEKRFEVQLGLGIYNGYITKEFAAKFRTLYPQLPGLLPEEKPSLLHGDLWNGNFMVGTNGNPFLIDPAVYYGNREMEIAFTRLFGGFDERFYQAYNDLFPLQPGFQQREEIYNLYPLLVHVNLFGTSYLSGVDRVIRKYC